MANVERIRLWVDALRSGDYKQTQDVLHRIDPHNEQTVGYCCLGVGCEVAIDNGLNINKTIASGNPKDRIAYDVDTVDMPIPVVEWYGIDDDTEDFVIMNDYEDQDFNTIADFIENKYINHA